MIDPSDSFYCLWLRPEDTLKLAVMFPSRPGEDPLAGILLTNSMGWYLSPPNFSVCTETVVDLANTPLEIPANQTPARMTPHRLDTIYETAPMDIPPITLTHIPSIPCTSPFQKHLRYWDTYLDNFCGLVRGNQWTCQWVKRILLRSLDRVFRPLDDNDTAF